MHVYAQSCVTLCNPLDFGPPGSSVRGIFQGRVLEWVAISFSRGSAQPRDFSFQNLTVRPQPCLGLLPEAGGHLVSRAAPGQVSRAQWRQGRG